MHRIKRLIYALMFMGYMCLQDENGPKYEFAYYLRCYDRRQANFKGIYTQIL